MKYGSNNCHVLVEDLMKKSEKYSLIKRLYLPIIATYADKYCIEDWLSVPYYEFLYRQDETRLKILETFLEEIYNNIEENEFKVLCSDVISYVKHPTCNGIHEKLFEFHTELEGMHWFSKKDYRIQRISRSNKEPRPDFRADKQGSSCIVECKFIHASNPIKTFINRYTRFLSLFCPDYKGNELLALDIDYNINCRFPHELTKEHIGIVKLFIKEIICEKRIVHEVVLAYEVKNSEGKKEQHSCRLAYTRGKPLSPCIVAIDDQLNFVEGQLNDFRKDYVARLIQTATNRQLGKYVQKGESAYLFICIQFDKQFSPPWEEINLIKNKIFGKDPNVIIKDVSGWV